MKIVAAVFGAVSLMVVGSASNAQEVSAQPLGLASGTVEAMPVLEGCGTGYVRDRFGRCRPRGGARVYRYIYRR